MNSTHNHLCDDVELYALGGLDEEEMGAFEQHLKSCAACQSRLEDLQDVTDALLYDVEEIEPPVGMRERVLSNVTSTPQQVIVLPVQPAATETVPLQPKTKTTRNWQQRILPYVAAVAVVAIALLGWQNVNLQQQNAAQRDQIDQLGKLVATIPLQSITNFKQANGEAMLLENGQEKIVMIKATNLPIPTNKQLYTLWIKNQNQVINGGTFIPTGNGMGMVVFPVTVQKFDSVAITLEPDAYSGNNPRGVPVMVGKVNL